jgi:hypothetical protein
VDGVRTVVPIADIKPHAQAEDPFASWPSTRPPLARIDSRGSDTHGDGHFGASRGAGRSHMGVDLNAGPGSPVYAPIGGTVYVGDPYGNDPTRRGQVHSVRIEAPGGQTIRMFYVQPDGRLAAGTVVEPGAYLGVSESLQALYPGITDHVHVQVEERSAGGRRMLNPWSLVNDWSQQSEADRQRRHRGSQRIEDRFHSED